MTVIRHLNKPTSGRYVYRAYQSPTWFWQCDLHSEEYDRDGEEVWLARTDLWGGGHRSMLSAFDEAYAHALVCPYRNEED